MSDDPELLWAMLLEKGHGGFDADDCARVALWVAGRFATTRPSDFLIETAEEAGRVAAFALDWIERDKPQVAVPLVRLSLAARERLLGPDAAPSIDSVVTLACVLAAIDAREDVPELRQQAAKLIERYLRVGVLLWGEFDFRIGDAALLGAQIAKADGRHGDEEVLLRRAIAIFKNNKGHS